MLMAPRWVGGTPSPMVHTCCLRESVGLLMDASPWQIGKVSVTGKHGVIPVFKQLKVSQPSRSLGKGGQKLAS